MTYSGTPNAAVAASPAKHRPGANRKVYLLMAGGALAALIAGASFKLLQDDRTSLGTESESTTGAEISEPSAAAFGSPFLQASPTLHLADPGLLRSTSPQARVETIAAGRVDPFAPLVMSSRVPAKPTSAVPTPPPPAVVAATPLPVVPVTATQSLPPLPQPSSLPSLPAPYVPGSALQDGQSVAVAPTASPVFQSLVEQVTVSGVVQVGNQVSAIVTEPGSHVGRRVSQGDVVAGGRIRIKTIDVSGPEPIVVLSYDGRDYPRSVGSAAMVGTL
jgi:hypothetical protein